MAKRQNHRRDKRAAQRSALEMASAPALPTDGGIASLMASSLGALPWAQLVSGGLFPTEPKDADERLFGAISELEPARAPAASPSLPEPGRATAPDDPFATPAEQERANALEFLRSKMGGGRP
jgi:hypothetical protein